MAASRVDSDGPTILVVDENPAVRASAQAQFQVLGGGVLFASDGFEALSSIVAYRPEIVLVDTMVSRLDGYQICALIKSNSDFQDIPVIMMSNSDVGFDEERARLVGCEAHVSKPFTASALMDAVEKFCHLET